MTANEYQKAALRTEAPKDLYMAPQAVLNVFARTGAITNPEDDLSIVRLLDGILGLAGESGEVADILKKVLFQGHKLDKDHIVKELGDIAWYLALASDALGYDLDTIFQTNIDKLAKRYPDGFEINRSIDREVGDI